MLFLPKTVVITAFIFGCLSLTSCGGGTSEGSSNGGNQSTPNNNTPLTFSAPNVSVSVNNQTINVHWDDSLAERYRVLYWQNNDAPSEVELTSLTYQTPSLSSGQYTVLIEAYDDLGNSVFSSPINAEIL